MEYKLTPIEDLRNWAEYYLKKAIHDDLYTIAHKYGKENNWDDVEVDFMIEEIEDKLVEGILNVIDTYEED
ncbi:hypothetical protein [Wansuia hejianensis]|uniref:Uncharacterized protein n=1 Tax=Wansuia hejianensis TaxID=2763667 RepID=A0A926F296_9FIRM|nr:hypothetical protein [Wansuia hejianensis]MBC8590629.1 hypothetical protein [Wansuia hejianensis]